MIRVWFRRVAPCVLIAVVTCVVGCGKTRPKTYPVEGQVVFPDKSPLRGGAVEFRSTQLGPDGLPFVAQGDIDEEGYFVLRTYGVEDGAVPGEYTVIVAPPPPPVVMPDNPVPPPLLDRRFSQHDKSGLRFIVQPEQNFFEVIIQKPASPPPPPAKP
jgi:hypothetical protein